MKDCILCHHFKIQIILHFNRRMSPLGLNQWTERTGRRRHLLQSEDHSGNDPRSVPGFLRSCSRNRSGLYPDLWIQKILVKLRQSTRNAAVVLNS